MENLKVIKNRLKTVNSIVKATNAMKMVSTVKLAKVNNLNKYSKNCAGILFDMFSKAANEAIFEKAFAPNFWLNRKSGKTLLIVLSTDQGFCGSFSQSILELAKNFIKENKDCYIEVFGKKGSSIKKNRPNNFEENLFLKSRYDIKDYANVLSKTVFEYITKHDVQNIYVVSGEFKNVLVQRAKISKIFPVETSDITKTEYTEIEGDKQEFIEEIFKFYLEKLFVGMVTEHLISELSARVMAMDNSVRNANDMFDKLNMLYNRIRQAKITQELTEIVSSIECVQ